MYEAWRATTQRDRKMNSTPADDELVETRIGSGTDHTVFLNHLGRPVMNLGFDGDYGVYHSMYDDHYWMSHIADPDFAYHVALTRVWGVLALRLANADALPLDFGAYGRALDGFLGTLERENPATAKQLTLKKLRQQIAEFEKEGSTLNAAVAKEMAAGKASPEKIAKLNGELMEVESNWLEPAGIPGRPWFQHLIYSSRYTYAHLELPGLTEAVENRDWGVAREQQKLLEKAVEKNTNLLKTSLSAWGKK
jgi:N-acetylated-alpha-linked acidic dipeptidase